MVILVDLIGTPGTNPFSDWDLQRGSELAPRFSLWVRRWPTFDHLHLTNSLLAIYVALVWVVCCGDLLYATRPPPWPGGVGTAASYLRSTDGMLLRAKMSR